MKCLACGYEYPKANEDGLLEKDEPFTKLYFSVTLYTYEGSGEYEEAGIVACPKCKTIRME